MKYAEKQLMRQEILANSSKYVLTSQQILDNAASIIAAYKPKIVALYNPLPGEVTLLPITNQFPDNIIFLIPKVIDKDSMVFVQYSSLHCNDKYESKDKIDSKNNLIPDMVFVPGLAFSIDGYRLGRGGGHFDRYLHKHTDIIAIGVCMQDQLKENLPYDTNDQKMNIIITDKTMIKYM